MDMLVGCLAGMVGTLLGLFLARNKKPDLPVCACGHHRSFHDPTCYKTGCQCRKYVGPTLDAAGNVISKEDRRP